MAYTKQILVTRNWQYVKTLRGDYVVFFKLFQNVSNKSIDQFMALLKS